MNRKLQIALIEPFYTGSHKKWSDGFAEFSSHQVKIVGLSGKFWKWRMHGAAITLAKRINNQEEYFDMFLVSDFLDLSLFKSLLLPKYNSSKFSVYFHENQLTYPWSPTDRDVEMDRDNHYAFINYSSALVADKVFFNSSFHKNSFLDALPAFLNQFPDFTNKETIDIISDKSKVLSLALELPKFEDEIKKIANSILWNHRWEYDKNPSDFFAVLKKLKRDKVDFKLIVLGEKTSKYPEIFDWAKKYFKNEILHWGYAKSNHDYWTWLQKADILPVTSIQDFFGISIVEAMYADVYPLLPDRLVYPEHIPDKHKDSHLYTSQEELYERLTNLLTKSRTRKEISKWIEKYEWGRSINDYDSKLRYS